MARRIRFILIFALLIGGLALAPRSQKGDVRVLEATADRLVIDQDYRVSASFAVSEARAEFLQAPVEEMRVEYQPNPMSLSSDGLEISAERNPAGDPQGAVSRVTADGLIVEPILSH